MSDDWDGQRSDGDDEQMEARPEERFAEASSGGHDLVAFEMKWVNYETVRAFSYIY